MGQLPKPQMRGLQLMQIKRNLVGMAVFSISVGLAFKFLYMDPKKRKYEEFYKTYDAEKRLKIMQDAGLMESHPI